MTIVKPDSKADTPIEVMTSLLEQARASTTTHEKDAYIEAALDISKTLDDYLIETTTPASTSLTNMIDATMKTDWNELHSSGKTNYHYNTNWCAGTFQAQFVATLCTLVNAKRILEIGMFTGTTAAAMADALPDDGLVVSCEIEPWLKEFASEFFVKAGLEKKIQVELGSAHDTIPKLAKAGQTFDLIFLDAEKTGYEAYYKAVMELGLLSNTGAFIVDNTLFKGQVYQAEPNRGTDAKALKRFNELVRDDPRVDVIILPVRDGVSIITHKKPKSKADDAVMTGHLHQNILQRFRLTGRSALVTGAAQGLGRSYAHALSEAGASLAIVDLQLSAAEVVAAEIRQKGGQAIAIQANVTSKSDCLRMVKETVAAFGKLDIAVNNAGINLSSPAEHTPESEFDATMSVNCKGVFLSCQAEALHMLDSGRPCSIINVASMSAVAVPHPQKQLVYNTSKAAVKKMTESMAVEWGGRDVRVNAIAPGIVKTKLITESVELAPLVETWLKQIPANRLADFSDCQGTIVYLASEVSEYVNGTIAIIDGGQQFQ